MNLIPTPKSTTSTRFFSCSIEITSPPPPTLLSQPYFEKSVRMRLTLPKWELGSPLRLSKLQSSITRVKRPHVVALFISLESYQNTDVENGLA
jgi:hypothetical protein